MPTRGGQEDGAGAEMTQEVWTPEPEGWVERQGVTCYLSVNATTLEARQEGLDLREWVDRKLVAYVDCLDMTLDARCERPHVGGVY